MAEISCWERTSYILLSSPPASPCMTVQVAHWKWFTGFLEEGDLVSLLNSPCGPGHSDPGESYASSYTP